MAEKSRNVTTHRLFMGFISILLLFITFGVISLIEIRTLSKVTRTIYYCPLVVSNASLRATASVIKMHRSMKDVTLFDIPSGINTAITAVNEQERMVYKNLDTVKKNILGGKGQKLENKTRHLFVKWKPIREEVIKLVREGKREEAAKITMGKGADHVAKLENKMLELTSYARNKATGFMEHGERVRSRVEETTIILMSIGILLSIIIAFFTIRRTQATGEALRQEKEFSESLINSSVDGILAFDHECRYTVWNPEMERISGVGKEEALGNVAFDVFPFLKETGEDKFFFEALSGKNAVAKDKSYVVPDTGRQGFFKGHYSPMHSESGEIVGGLAIIRDISQRKQSEEALRESERHLKIRNQINNIFLTYPDENMYEEVLNAVLKVMESEYGTFGYFDEQGAFVAPAVTRKIYWDKCNVPEKDIIFQKGTFAGIWGKSIKERKTLLDNDGPFNTPEGHIPIENTIATPIIFRDEVISAVHLANKPNGYGEEDKEMMETIVRQISPVLYARLQRDKQEKERKKAEEQIKASLREKEVLLGEIYHRTKNNMQVICGLLSLQSMHIKDKEVLKIFKETENRIQSMALVHQKLYQTKDLSKIDLKDYIWSLGDSLLTSYQTETGRISFHVEGETIPLLIDAAVPCGLVINELISNSLKHAFPNGKEGEIRISLHLTDENEIEIQFRDNGIGFPGGFDIGDTESLGLQLVKDLTESQLRGKVELKEGKEMEIQIRFKESAYKERV